jgi:hypothetical protein
MAEAAVPTTPLSAAQQAAAARELSWCRALAFSARLLARDWRAGELRVLAVGLIVAVTSLTTVAFFADRVKQALSAEANQLLGADLMVISDRPIAPALAERARELGLATVQLVRFPSMTVAGENTVLTEIKAVGPGYPLKGRIAIRTGPDAEPARRRAFPMRGTVWVDDRLLARLGVGIGDALGVGERHFRIAAQVVEDPETSVGFLNLGPRLTLNLVDLQSTGLIMVGSRVSYRLGVAGAPAAIAAFRAQAERSIGPGQRVEDVRDARPEIRSALERAEKFLGLSALLSVILAAVAVALAARRYLRRHLDGVAIMRCLGASQGDPAPACRAVRRAGPARERLGCLLGVAGQSVLAACSRRWLAWRCRCRAGCRCCTAARPASRCCSASRCRQSSRCAACRRCACCGVTSDCRIAPAGPATRWALRRWVVCCCGRRRTRRPAGTCSAVRSVRWPRSHWSRWHCCDWRPGRGGAHRSPGVSDSPTCSAGASAPSLRWSRWGSASWRWCC